MSGAIDALEAEVERLSDKLSSLVDRVHELEAKIDRSARSDELTALEGRVYDLEQRVDR